MNRLFVLTFIFFIFLTTVCQSKMVAVNRETVNLRSGPGEKYEIQYEYGKGFPLLILASKGSWYKVKDFEGDTGWVYEPLVHTTGHLIVKANKNSKKKINIRFKPTTESKVIAEAYYGVVFKTLLQKNGWAKIEHESGTVGWVKRSLLWGF